MKYLPLYIKQPTINQQNKIATHLKNFNLMVEIGHFQRILLYKWSEICLSRTPNKAESYINQFFFKSPNVRNLSSFNLYKPNTVYSEHESWSQESSVYTGITVYM